MIADAFERPLRNLRLSVTDRCNLRCQYCMPEEEYAWLPRGDILTFEEVGALAGVFTELGVNKVRITGGEPLLRRDIDTLVRILAGNACVTDLAMTTNGVLLEEYAAKLREAGLHRVTVSLDTLKADRFKALTQRGAYEKVLNGINAAVRAGFKGLKLDAVIVRGWNDDELVDLIEYGKRVDAEVRFIEYMDVGGATRWSPDHVVPRAAMLELLSRSYGPVEPVIEENSAPADRYRLQDGTVFGIISSMTAPFCHSCDRSRLTADGMWYLCLYAESGADLRTPLRNGASVDELKALIVPNWLKRQNRGAEERLVLRDRAPFIHPGALRKDPHLEMHTRGG